MKFNLINFDTWSRKEVYLYYTTQTVCTYTMTVNIDITSIKGRKIYPTMMWLITSVVNEMEEFRTAKIKGELGVFDSLNPAYTIFNKDFKRFSVIWSYYKNDYESFLIEYNKDNTQYSKSTQMFPKLNRPINSFDISMIPWITFSSFSLQVQNCPEYYLPIFTMGKIFEDKRKCYIPLSIQVHHAVCDGYHVAQFVERLQYKIDNFII